MTKLRLLSATHRTGHGTPPHHLHKLYSPGHTICSSKPKPVNAACGAMHPVPPYTYNMFDVCTQCGFVVIRGSSWEHRCGEEHSTSAPPNSYVTREVIEKKEMARLVCNSMHWEAADRLLDSVHCRSSTGWQQSYRLTGGLIWPAGMHSSVDTCTPWLRSGFRS